MKKIFFLVFLITSTTAFAQQTITGLVGSFEKVEAKKKTENGMRTLLIPVIVKTPKKIPDLSKRVFCKININSLDYNGKPGIVPVVINSEAYIIEYLHPTLKTVIKGGVPALMPDSSQWIANAVCVIQLLDTTRAEKSYFLFLENSSDAAHKIVLVPEIISENKSLTPTDSVKKENSIQSVNPKEKTAAETTSRSAAETKKTDPKTQTCQFSLDNKLSILTPNYTKNTIKLDTLRLTIFRDKKPEAHSIDTINFVAKKYLFPFDVTFVESSIIIADTLWTESNKKIFKDTFLIVKIPAVSDTLTKTSTSAYVYINCNNTSTHGMQLNGDKETAKKEYAAELPFWAEVGTNFDLIDKIQAQNIYGGLFMFEKDIAGFKNKKRISFTGGVYETKSTSLSSSSDSGIIYRDNRSFSYNQANQGYPFYRDTGSISATSDVTSVGLFISPHYRLTNIATTENGFHLYVSLYAEMLWQRVRSSYDFSKTHADTTYYAPDVRRYNFKETMLNKDYRSHYFGLGMPIYIRDFDPSERWRFSFYLNSVFGFSTQQFIALRSPIDSTNTHYDVSYLRKAGVLSDPLTNTFAAPKHNWNPFYLFQFRLNEEKIGVSITGEVRGFALQGSKPIISLSVSKKFDIATFYNSITKSSTPSVNTQ